MVINEDHVTSEIDIILWESMWVPTIDLKDWTHLVQIELLEVF